MQFYLLFLATSAVVVASAAVVAVRQFMAGMLFLLV